MLALRGRHVVAIAVGHGSMFSSMNIVAQTDNGTVFAFSFSDGDVGRSSGPCSGYRRTSVETFTFLGYRGAGNRGGGFGYF